MESRWFHARLSVPLGRLEAELTRCFNSCSICCSKFHIRLRNSVFITVHAQFTLESRTCETPSAELVHCRTLFGLLQTSCCSRRLRTFTRRPNGGQMMFLIAILTVFISISPVLNDLNNRYRQCLEKASELKQLVEPGIQTLDGKAMTVGFIWNSSFLLCPIVFVCAIIYTGSRKNKATRTKIKLRGCLHAWREENPTRRIILAPYVYCSQFTCKKLYYPSTRIFLEIGSS